MHWLSLRLPSSRRITGASRRNRAKRGRCPTGVLLMWSWWHWRRRRGCAHGSLQSCEHRVSIMRRAWRLPAAHLCARMHCLRGDGAQPRRRTDTDTPITLRTEGNAAPRPLRPMPWRGAGPHDGLRTVCHVPRHRQDTRLSVTASLRPGKAATCASSGLGAKRNLSTPLRQLGSFNYVIIALTYPFA